MPRAPPASPARTPGRPGSRAAAGMPWMVLLLAVGECSPHPDALRWPRRPSPDHPTAGRLSLAQGEPRGPRRGSASASLAFPPTRPAAHCCGVTAVATEGPAWEGRGLRAPGASEGQQRKPREGPTATPLPRRLRGRPRAVHPAGGPPPEQPGRPCPHRVRGPLGLPGGQLHPVPRRAGGAGPAGPGRPARRHLQPERRRGRSHLPLPVRGAG